jgi:hypothetical protein
MHNNGTSTARDVKIPGIGSGQVITGLREVGWEGWEEQEGEEQD